MSDERHMATLRVADIQPGVLDFAGNEIGCVYVYNPPDYAVYRTPARVMVQFADDRKLARQQRARLRDLTWLRGEINGLIDGWHSGRDTSGSWWPGSRRRAEDLYKRAVRYDRRVADAVVTALEDDSPTACRLLAEVKNDVISERESMARWTYLWLAFLLGIGNLAVAGFFGSVWFEKFAGLDLQVRAVWDAVIGGTIGAFFSIAIGLKGKTVLIDLQNRDNYADAILRMLIGSIAGGVLLCLLLSGLVTNTLLKPDNVDPSNKLYSPLLVFVIGFLGGFFERLVPNFLAQTNLGTKEKTGDRPAAPGGSSGTGAGGIPGPTGTAAGGGTFDLGEAPAEEAAPAPGDQSSAVPAAAGENNQSEQGTGSPDGEPPAGQAPAPDESGSEQPGGSSASNP
jgi:hypothetical protein